MAKDIAQEVTDRLVAAIEAGAGEWKMPWHSGGKGGMPRNAVTGHRYRGANIPLLWVTADACGYGTSEWASYKQWAERGAQVRKGEKGTMVTYWGVLQQRGAAEGEDDDGTPGRKRLFLKCSFVFNAAQVDGYEPATVERPNLAERLAHADEFVAATGARIIHGGGRAFYRPSTDDIHMPDRDRFTPGAEGTATETYYGTLLHELVHWTGPEHRLAREFGKRFGDKSYAFEELVAELGAAFLCADLGISPAPRLDHAQYLQHWLEVLKSDKRAIFTAAARASDAHDYLRGLMLATSDDPAEPLPIAA